MTTPGKTILANDIHGQQILTIEQINDTEGQALYWAYENLQHQLNKQYPNNYNQEIRIIITAKNNTTIDETPNTYPTQNATTE